MTDQDKKNLNKIGSELAAKLIGFFGKVSFNIHNGNYVNANIEESIKPEQDKGK